MTSENTETKTIEELANSLTLEQVKEQMALYHRLYHKLRKEQDPEYIKRKTRRNGNATGRIRRRTNLRNTTKSIMLLSL